MGHVHAAGSLPPAFTAVRKWWSTAAPTVRRLIETGAAARSAAFGPFGAQESAFLAAPISKRQALCKGAGRRAPQLSGRNAQSWL